jgi:hypothetical protein
MNITFNSTIPSMSIKLNGNLPSQLAPVVILEASGAGATGAPLKFTFSAPKLADVNYEMGFCIGPASNPCGLPAFPVINVPGGQERSAVIDAGVFKNNILVAHQGTNEDLPFVMTIEIE